MGSFPKKGQAIVTAIATIAVPGTQAALSTTRVFCNWLVIQALSTNTDDIIIGGTNADLATNLGVRLAARNTVTLDNVYLSEVFLDVAVGGQGVQYTYQEKRKIT